MKTLEEIKKEVREQFDFREYHNFGEQGEEAFIDEVAKRYANEKLDEAKERIWDASLTADRYWNEKLIISLKDEV